MLHEHVIQPVIAVSSIVAIKAEKQIRAWLWALVWKRTSLLLFMTYMHEEVWLPLVLSMIGTAWVIGYVYHVEDDCRQYIPKRHRKWARYRNQCCLAAMKRCTIAMTQSKWISRLSEAVAPVTRVHHSCQRSRRTRSETASEAIGGTMIKLVMMVYPVKVAGWMSASARRARRVVQSARRHHKMNSDLWNELGELERERARDRGAFEFLLIARMSSTVTVVLLASAAIVCLLYHGRHAMPDRVRLLRKGIERLISSSKPAPNPSAWMGAMIICMLPRIWSPCLGVLTRDIIMQTTVSIGTNLTTASRVTTCYYAWMGLVVTIIEFWRQTDVEHVKSTLPGKGIASPAITTGPFTTASRAAMRLLTWMGIIVITILESTKLGKIERYTSSTGILAVIWLMAGCLSILQGGGPARAPKRRGRTHRKCWSTQRQ
jgi:hypothetical protein